MAVASATRTFPVIEVFGPTVQGEGALAGTVTSFVRLGGCDYRCSWCDSMYAVEPALVRAAEKLTADEILERLPAVEWVTLSGGNPALHDLGAFVDALHDRDHKVCVETQGSIWREWLAHVDLLTVSPKPPSAGMLTARNILTRDAFMCSADIHVPPPNRCIKIVVFDQADLDWATMFLTMHADWSAYLSVGTDPVGQWGSEVRSAIKPRDVRDRVGDRYRWLCEAVAACPELHHARVLPQLHVLAWGHQKGV